MPEPSRYVAHGYAADFGRGPLSIVSVSGTNLVLAGTVAPRQDIVVRLQQGDSVDEVLEDVSAIGKHQQEIPLAGLQELIWREGQNGLVVVYEGSDRHIRRATTYVGQAELRRKIISALEDHFGRRLELREEPAPILGVIWAQLVGAVLSIAGGVLMYVLWDPVAVGRVRGGGIAVWLGREGCVFVAACFLIGCLYDAWRRLHPHPQIQRWIV